MRLVLTLAVLTLTVACSSGTGPGGSGGGSGGAGGFTCTTATLFAGNPEHNDPMARPADGTGLLQDPPFPYRQVVFSNGQLITHDGQEIWRANLTDGKLHKLAGTESLAQALKTGACSTSRFANISQIALASDGSLFVSDYTGNAIFKITDPLGAGCSVAHYAGTPMDMDEGTFNPNMPPNVGNMDGPGAMAKFGQLERMALDGSDNIYVFDDGNNAIRKIASDAMHTVSTFVPNLVPGGGAWITPTFMGGKLYVFGLDGNDFFLASYDSSGAKTTLTSGRADKFNGDSSDSMTLGTIVNDGSNLYVYFSGQLFQISPTGAIKLPALAGVYHPGLDFSSGYDSKASHPADKVELLARDQTLTAGISAFVTLDASKNLYVSASQLNSYVEKIACTP